MLPAEAMMFQGWPIESLWQLPPTLSHKTFQSLAGNAVAPPCLLALVMSTIMAITWKSKMEAAPEEDPEVEEALRLLAMIAPAQIFHDA